MDAEYKLDKYIAKYRSNKKNKLYKSKYKYYKTMFGGFSSIDDKYIIKLDTFIKQYNDTKPEHIIDDSHGLSHMLVVLCHASKALDAHTAYEEDQLSEKDELKVKLAALLHDIDDAKYFPNNKKYENARMILTEVNTDKNELSDGDIEDIIEMISWVSSSVNGDRIPEKAINNEYLLYPRYADRLEALGLIGVERTLHYTLKQKQKGNPKGVLFTKETLKGISADDIFNNIATQKRYESYSTASDSMIDHFYDKLLRLGVYPIKNDYFESETKKRQQPLIDIVLFFGRSSDDLTEDELKNYIEDYIKKQHSISTKCMCDEEVQKFLS